MKENKVFRICIIKKQLVDRQTLFRIVRTPQGTIEIEVDIHLPGRGCYLTKDKDVVLTAKKRKALSRTLKCEVSDEIYDKLLAMC